MEKDLEISIELTNDCPLRCIHCSSRGGENVDKKKELTTEEIKKVLKDGKEKLGVTSFSLSGGEPLLREDAIELMRYAKEEIGLRILLYTSGVLGTPENPTPFDDKLVEKIAKYSDKIIFSIEGDNEKTYETITAVKGSWKVFVKSLKKTVETGAFVECHIVPEKINWKEIPGMVEFCKQHGVKKVSLLRLVPQGRAKDNKDKLLLSKEQFKELNKMMEKLKMETKGIEFRFGNPINFCFLNNHKPKLTACGGGWDRILIRPYGDVHVCAGWKEMKHLSAGNIRISTIDDIWFNSPIYKMFREFNYQMLVGECKTCPYVPICKGGCPAQRLIEYGDIRRGPDPLCFRHLVEK